MEEVGAASSDGPEEAGRTECVHLGEGEAILDWIFGLPRVGAFDGPTIPPPEPTIAGRPTARARRSSTGGTDAATNTIFIACVVIMTSIAIASAFLLCVRRHRRRRGRGRGGPASKNTASCCEGRDLLG